MSSTLGSAESHLVEVCGLFFCSAIPSTVGRKKAVGMKGFTLSKATISMKLVAPPPHSLCTVIVAPSSPLMECVPAQHSMFWSAALFWRVTIQKCHLLTHQICHFNVFRSRSVHFNGKSKLLLHFVCYNSMKPIQLKHWNRFNFFTAVQKQFINVQSWTQLPILIWNF